MTIEIHFDGGTTYLKGVNEVLRAHLNQSLTWKDKAVTYLIVQKGQSWLDPYRYCYDVARDSFATGLIPRVVDLLEDFGAQFTYHCNYDYLEPTPKALPEWAFDHQRAIVENALEYKRSLCSSPTASGKSFAIAFFLTQFPCARALITVPSVNLLYNMTRTLEKVIDEPIGKVGNGKADWRRITVGIINSLARHCEGKFARDLAEQQIMVIDEAHAGASASYQKVSISCVNTAYRLAVSATPTRTDGADLVLEGVSGPKTLVIPPSVMVDLNIIHAPEAYFLEVDYADVRYKGAQYRKDAHGRLETYYPTPNSKPDPEVVYTQALVRNAQRNALAVQVGKYFLQSVARGGNLLFLVKAIEHGHLLKEEAAKQGLDIEFIDGSVKGEERMAILDDFRSGKTDALIASSILNEGEDLPLLEMVINCAGGANQRINTQRDGRVLRIDRSGRKRRAIKVDFYDKEPFYLAAHSRKRMQIINNAYPNSARIVTLDELLKALDGEARAVEGQLLTRI